MRSNLRPEMSKVMEKRLLEKDMLRMRSHQERQDSPRQLNANRHRAERVSFGFE
ncbi:hypothetical protein ACFO4O_15200 [Glaciecola siphonariae]|uniref:Uncharacterized protein n=1 Tax=Glaciecola siphonariae TaxID=521012 RepID=A0ABV9M1D4_9ALTE